MPRLARKYYNSTYYHVMVQGNSKKVIFKEKEDMVKFCFFMSYYLKEHDVNVVAYCLMKNHVHLLIEAHKVEELSLYMHKLNGIYAVYFNKKYENVGYLYRSRFKSQEIISEIYLKNCINYIHNNPVKAKICNSIYDYEFSSAKEYRNLEIDNKSPFIFIDTDEDFETNLNSYINEYLEANQIKKMELKLKENNDFLKELVINLNKINKVSFRKISEILGINREKLRKILN